MLRVLSRSERDRIIIPIDCDMCQAGDLVGITALVCTGMIVWLDRYALCLPRSRNAFQLISVNVYLLTPAGSALCEQHGIKQR
jgi:hypothetical protein